MRLKKISRWTQSRTLVLLPLLLLTGPLAALERTPTMVKPSRSEFKSHVTTGGVRDALGLIASDVASISFGSSSHIGFDVFGTAATLFPTQGTSYFVMSSGDTASALTPNSSESTSTELDGLNTVEGEDLVQIVLVLNPPAMATCLAFDFAFYSEEFPEFVGSEFNDVFLAEFGQSTFQQVDEQIIAPNNFAFDTQGNVVSVNTVFGVTAAAADGTTYDGGTPLLTARTPLEDPGEQITIILSIMDLGDSIYDSSAFVDNFRWLFGVACEPGADADSDRDALLDGWETDGIDFDNDGTVDLDLPAMGADPMHKDIFIEIDYMVLGGMGGHTHEPKAAALQIVRDAFDNAAVSNPDGTDGIHLHIDAGSGTVMDPVTNTTWGTRSRSNTLTHQNNLGTCTNGTYNWTAFDNIKGVGMPGMFDVERGDVFHYVIFGHSLCAAKGLTSGISRGIPGSDWLVTLGGWTDNVGSVNEQAGTLMHEGGHNLGLLHGGDDGSGNYEPNYLSIMNYFFQTSGLRISGNDGNFDYSRFALPQMDENSLDETVGLSGVPEAAGYGTRYYDATGTSSLVNDINGPVDWSGDGPATATNVAVDVNGTVHDGAPAPFGGVGSCSLSTDLCFVDAHCAPAGGVCQTLTVLDNTDNWDEIVFNGGAVGALGEQIILPVEIDDPALNDITEEEDKAIPTEFAVGVMGPSVVYLAAGKSVHYGYVVVDTGDNPDSFSVDAVATQPWANLSGLPTTVALIPGESTTIEIMTTVPPGTPGGTTDSLTVSAHSDTNPAMMDQAKTTTIVSIASIDIKPSSSTNPINTRSRSVIPVAVLGSPMFDVANVDVTTLAFGLGNAKPTHMNGGHLEDVNSDGIMDLVSHYRIRETGIAVGDTEACLTGQTVGGTEFGDCDPVRVM